MVVVAAAAIWQWQLRSVVTVAEMRSNRQEVAATPLHQLRQLGVAKVTVVG